MGNSNQSHSFFQKGQGLRILSIKLNSPFDGKVQPFFDFIIDVIPLQPQRSPKEILDKLTSQSQKIRKIRTKDFNQIITQNQDKKLQLKIVSTKQRNVRSIMITPNRNWNGSMDLIGIKTRKQKYDQAFDTYAPVADIFINSPIHLAGVKEGQYLLGCLEFQYTSLNQFIEGLYDRFFDKQINDKHVHLALYDILNDEVSIKPILLKRGWGGKGLLGCEFMQGQLYKFPSNFKQRRAKLLQQQKVKIQRQKIKFQLGECNGASKTLVEALKNKKNRKGKHMQAIKNMISIPLPEIREPDIMERCETANQEANSSNKINEQIIHQQNMRITFLERRLTHVQQTLTNIKQYLDIISQEEILQEQREMVSAQKRKIQENAPNKLNLTTSPLSPSKK